MSGTLKGGQAAAKTNKERYGKDYYARIGSIGGKSSKGGLKGFAAMPEWKRRAAGAKGGSVSRRGKSK